MKYRIAMWASVGFLIAVSWAVYAFATTAPAMTSGDPIMAFVELSCPIAFVSLHFHFGVSLYWSVVANAVTYALFGLAVEAMRHRLQHAR